MKATYSRRLVVGLVVVSLLALANRSPANLVLNGDFEQPSLPFANGWALYRVGESFHGWTVGAGTVDVDRWGPVGTDSLDAGRTTGPESWSAASGSQSLDLNGYGPGSVYQDLTTVPNSTYYLSFALAGNVVGGPLTVRMQYAWAPGVTGILDFNVGNHDGYDVGWTYYQYAITAPSGASLTRLEFTSLSNTGARGPALDDVFVDYSPRSGIPVEGVDLVTAAVPEPSTIIAGGLALVALLLGLRGRRTQ